MANDGMPTILPNDFRGPGVVSIGSCEGKDGPETLGYINSGSIFFVRTVLVTIEYCNSATKGVYIWDTLLNQQFAFDSQKLSWAYKT